MIALRRHDVDDLNHRARVKMAATEARQELRHGLPRRRVRAIHR
jgi:hypothetical protein